MQFEVSRLVQMGERQEEAPSRAASQEPNINSDGREIATAADGQCTAGASPQAGLDERFLRNLPASSGDGGGR